MPLAQSIGLDFVAIDQNNIYNQAFMITLDRLRNNARVVVFVAE